jgi:tetratricopeptide (TPR) repeat protein
MMVCLTDPGLINCYIQYGKLGEASITAKEALALFPHSAHAVCLAGIVMSQSQNTLVKAKEYFNKALTMDPKSLKALLALGEYLFKHETCQNAIDLLEANSTYHHIDTFHVTLGDYYQHLGDWAKSTQNYQIALKLTIG